MIRSVDQGSVGWGESSNPNIFASIIIAMLGFEDSPQPTYSHRRMMVSP